MENEISIELTHEISVTFSWGTMTMYVNLTFNGESFEGESYEQALERYFQHELDKTYPTAVHISINKLGE